MGYNKSDNLINILAGGGWEGQDGCPSAIHRRSDKGKDATTRNTQEEFAMKLGRILRNSLEGAVPRLVVVQPERECVIDLATAEYQRLLGTGASEEAARRLASALYPSSMSAAIAAGPTFLTAATRTASTSVGDGSALLPFEQVQWLAPLDPPVMRDCLAFEQHLRNSFKGDLVPPQTVPQH